MKICFCNNKKYFGIISSLNHDLKDLGEDINELGEGLLNAESAFYCFFLPYSRRDNISLSNVY